MFVKITLWSVLVTEKFIFYIVYEKVGVATVGPIGCNTVDTVGPIGSNTVDLFVVVVTKLKTVEGGDQFSHTE